MKTLRFLLLEDSLLDAELAQASLAEGGINCELVRIETRASFLAALESEFFDLILADYILPSFDGISALEIARNRCPEVPFIFVSATLGEELAIEALKSGATDYVLKHRLERLVPCVQRALREAKERRKRQHVEEELERLLQREQAARAEAEAANRIKDEFLAVLSHELRTPLNPILGWARLLRTKKYDEATINRALETIERNAKLQTQLIEDLLDVSRILQSKLSLKTCPVDLVFIIKSAIETVQIAADAKSIQIQTLLEPGVRQVLGDLNRLQQIVWNLLANAVKFTPQGGRVEIRLEAVGSQAQIQVIDTGKGISADFLPHVFDYFRQADGSTTRVFGGLGLGLAIVRRLVELHGGTVAAESLGEGQGATFTVRLPLMNVQPKQSEEDKSLDSSLTLSGVRVLVVDDDCDSRDFLIFVLEQYGAFAISVASTSEALETLKQFKPDILISDIGMPIEDGYSLIRQVRSLSPEQGANIPAIALTAYAGEMNQQQALVAGFQKHISKPIEPSMLVQVISGLVRST